MEYNYDYDDFNGVNSFITSKFCDIFPNYETFKNVYDEMPNKMKLLSESYLELNYYLLYGRYGNSTISNTDTQQFYFRLFSIIYQYGPLWEKKSEIQKYVRNLTTDSAGNFTTENIKSGTKIIMNSALNPGNEPSTNSLTELEYINNQNTTNYKKDDLKAVTDYWLTLSEDVTEIYLGRFKNLFLQIVETQSNVTFSD